MHLLLYTRIFSIFFRLLLRTPKIITIIIIIVIVTFLGWDKMSSNGVTEDDDFAETIREFYDEILRVAYAKDNNLLYYTCFDIILS